MAEIEEGRVRWRFAAGGWHGDVEGERRFCFVPWNIAEPMEGWFIVDVRPKADWTDRALTVGEAMVTAEDRLDQPDREPAELTDEQRQGRWQPVSAAETIMVDTEQCERCGALSLFAGTPLGLHRCRMPASSRVPTG